MILGVCWNQFGVIWGSFWGYFGSNLGVILGVILGFWGALGALWGTQEGPKSVQERQNVDFETV